MDTLAEFAALERAPGFAARHIGPDDSDIDAMLREVGAASLDDLTDRAVPPGIRIALPDLPAPLDEAGVIAELRALARRNVLKRSLIGCGYYGTHTPAVIRRNVLENPGWYTAYTPYQAEIAQGRLEALLIFQTMVADLTSMAIANASLLDEGTAVAEAVHMAQGLARGASRSVAVAADLHPQTRAVLATRAAPLGLTLVDVAPGDTVAIRAANPFAV
ncbi:MAG TPA: glycine dehydrogenase (aminomethyl-transferring), partial [Acetobacteraceae bacterium]|nr:glycine dehydrogenase (aminomethyl-transferring) [Acetobacteraceae bacterium]